MAFHNIPFANYHKTQYISSLNLTSSNTGFIIV